MVHRQPFLLRGSWKKTSAASLSMLAVRLFGLQRLEFWAQPVQLRLDGVVCPEKLAVRLTVRSSNARLSHPGARWMLEVAGLRVRCLSTYLQAASLSLSAEASSTGLISVEPRDPEVVHAVPKHCLLEVGEEAVQADEELRTSAAAIPGVRVILNGSS